MANEDAKNRLTSHQVLMVEELLKKKLIDENQAKELINSSIPTVTKPTFREYTISSGSITISRDGVTSYIAINTQGAAASDDLDNINVVSSGSFAAGDRLICKQANNARSVIFTSAGNIYPGGSSFAIQAEGEYLHLIFYGSTWRYWGSTIPHRVDEIGGVVWTEQEVTLAGNIATVTPGEASLISLQSTRTAETRATATFTVSSTPGSAGSADLYIDEGSGAVSVGNFAYTSATTPNAFAASLEAALTLPTGYTSSVLTNVVTITAPAGTGADANSFTLSDLLVNVTGTSAGFASGADGTDQDDTLDTVSGAKTGQLISFENRMTANNIQCTGSGFETGVDFTLGPLKRSPFFYWDGSKLRGIGSECCYSTELVAYPTDMLAASSVPLYSLTANASTAEITLGTCADGHVIRAFDPTNIEFASMTFRIPNQYVTGTDVVIKVAYLTKNVDSNNPCYMHIGGQVASVPEPGPGDELTPPVAVFQGNYDTLDNCEPELVSYTFPDGTFSFMPGGMLTVSIVREGSNAADTYTDDLGILWVAAKFKTT